MLFDLPVEENLTQLALQASDLRADRGLGDMRTLGGPCEVGLLGHGDEVLQLPQFHNKSR